MSKLNRLPPAGALGVLLFANSLLCAVERPGFFLVLNPNSDYLSHVRALENSGAHIKMTVPPRVIIGDAPSLSSMDGFSAVGQVYRGLVPLNDVRPLGPVAVAATVQWNKSASALKTPTAGFQSQATLDAAGLEAPRLTRTDAVANHITVDFSAVEGASLYEIQLCADAAGERPLRKTRTDRTTLTLPVDQEDPATVFIRIRAGDRPSALDPAQDVWGSWSAMESVSAVRSARLAGDAAQPTSPVDAYAAVGFSTVLEWSGADRVRIQISKSSDFQALIVDQIADAGELTPASSALHVGDTLFWRVRRWDEALGPWSATRSYSVQEPRLSQNDMFVNPEAPR